MNFPSNIVAERQLLTDLHQRSEQRGDPASAQDARERALRQAPSLHGGVISDWTAK